MSVDYRLLLSLSVFGLMLGWEWIRPLRPLTQNRFSRWTANIGLGVFNVLIVKLLASGLLVLSADYVHTNGIGLIPYFQLSQHIHPWLLVGLSLLILDCAIYWQHVASHNIDLIWRLHRVHHTDANLDATTAIRFHPLEILLSLGYKTVLVFIFGFDATTTIVFETMLYAAATFNHANIKLPPTIDHWVKKVIITPSLHLIHHSDHVSETNSNYGFSIALWDRLFGSYKSHARQPSEKISLGIKNLPRNASLFTLLLLPFKKNNATAKKTAANRNNK